MIPSKRCEEGRRGKRARGGFLKEKSKWKEESDATIYDEEAKERRRITKKEVKE